jgi:hypothetical protein
MMAEGGKATTHLKVNVQQKMGRPLSSKKFIIRKQIDL